jgi:hypothetical protein
MNTIYGSCQVFIERSGPVAVFDCAQGDGGPLSLRLIGQSAVGGRFLVFGQLIAQENEVALGVISASAMEVASFARLSGRAVDGMIEGLPWAVDRNGAFEGQLFAVWNGRVVLQGEAAAGVRVVATAATDAAKGNGNNGNGSGNNGNEDAETRRNGEGQERLPFPVPASAAETGGAPPPCLKVVPTAPVAPFPNDPSTVPAFEPFERAGAGDNGTEKPPSSKTATAKPPRKAEPSAAGNSGPRVARPSGVRASAPTSRAPSQGGKTGGSEGARAKSATGGSPQDDLFKRCAY